MKKEARISKKIEQREINRNKQRWSRLIPKKFSVVWSVEGSLESIRELSSRLESYSRRMNRNLLVSIIFSISLFTMSAFAFALHVFELFDTFTYHPSLLEDLIFSFIFRIIGSIIVIAFSVTLLILIYQTRNFTKVLTSRFRALENLWNTSGLEVNEDVNKDLSKLELSKVEDCESKCGESNCKGSKGENIRIEPMFASLSMIDEVCLQFPQILKQLKIALFLNGTCISAIVISILLSFLYGFSFSFLLPFSNLNFSIFLGLVLVLLGIISFSGIKETSLYYASFSQRYKIVSSISECKPPVVPKGDSAVVRFKEYLLKNDGRLIDATTKKRENKSVDYENELNNLDEKGEVLTKRRVKGASGQVYDFDLAFLPSGKADYLPDYLLLVREIGLESLMHPHTIETYYREIEDIIDEIERRYNKNKKIDRRRSRNIRSRRIRYVRAVLLFDGTKYEAWEVPSAILYQIKAYPIFITRGKGGGNDITHIQLVIDEGEMYSFVPFLPEYEIE